MYYAQSKGAIEHYHDYTCTVLLNVDWQYLRMVSLYISIINVHIHV